jgi:hypothetical protein
MTAKPSAAGPKEPSTPLAKSYAMLTTESGEVDEEYQRRLQSSG